MASGSLTLKLTALFLILFDLVFFINKPPGAASSRNPVSKGVVSDSAQPENIANCVIPPETGVKKAQTLLFTGDMMFDREVEILMKKNGASYPFMGIGELVDGKDMVIGNLEGPVVKVPEDFPRSSLTFNFMPQTGEALAGAKFNLVSLANNHTGNRGDQGVLETREILKNNGIDFMGDAITCGNSSMFVKEDLVFLAFNKTYPQNCSDAELSKAVETARAYYPDGFVVVMMHWGEEYKPVNNAPQQKLGRQIIDSGADVVIGHHPHVAQNIEIYNNKPIFYSLGNFIFDQYFSRETQEGLTVGVEVYRDKVVYRLFPVDIGQSQPHLMSEENRLKFLRRIAAYSDPALKEDISNGVLSIIR